MIKTKRLLKINVIGGRAMLEDIINGRTTIKFDGAFSKWIQWIINFWAGVFG